MKYKSKTEFVTNVSTEWRKLWELVDDIPDDLLTRRLGDEAPRSITDHLGHLYCWHRLLLEWVKSGPEGQPDLPCRGYRWNQTRALNQVFHDQLENDSCSSVRRRLKLSHGRVMKFVDQLSETQLLQPGHYVWTKKLPLISYVGPNTAGHYRWAQKKIRRAKPSLLG